VTDSDAGAEICGARVPLNVHGPWTKIRPSEAVRLGLLRNL